MNIPKLGDLYFFSSSSGLSGIAQEVSAHHKAVVIWLFTREMWTTLKIMR